jgi:ubiquitin carboxyl-terminal hydrolase 36/42
MYEQVKKILFPLNFLFMILEDLSRKSHILSSRIEFIQAKGEKVFVQSRTKVETDLPLVWKSVTAVGPGLVNMGNTCFLNSVLQCLAYIPALAQTLLSSRHNCASVSSCTLFAMEEHIKLMNHANKPVVPKAILSKLRFISKALKLGRQEDAHEFLLGLLDSMQKYCARKSDNSTVKSIFDGSIQSIVKCRVCKHESKTTDPMMDIALDIKHCHDIKTALSKYTKKELLAGGNRYFCER